MRFRSMLLLLAVTVFALPATLAHGRDKVVEPVRARKPSPQTARGSGNRRRYYSFGTYLKARRKLGGSARAWSNLLHEPVVLQELKIDRTTAYAVSRAISRTHMAASKKLRDAAFFGSPQTGGATQSEMYRKIIDEYEVESRKALRSVLRNDQIKRLGQLELQYRGMSAFTAPAVAKPLKFTTTQLQKLQRLEREFVRARGAAIVRFSQGNVVNRQKIEADRDAIKRVYFHKALKVLSKEQQKEFHRLVGKPVDFHPR